MNLELAFILKSILLHQKRGKTAICANIGSWQCHEIKYCSNCPLSVRIYAAYPGGNIVTQLTKVMERIS